MALCTGGGGLDAVAGDNTAPSDSTTARDQLEQATDALNRGRVSKGQGDLEGATEHFQQALTLAPPDSEVARQARDEVEYYVPLMAVQQAYFAGDFNAAESILQELIERYRADPDRHGQLSQILATLQQARTATGGGRAGNAAGRQVISKAVVAALEEFRRKTGHYPSGYRELNEILPADQTPLTDYDIVQYIASGEGYHLVLRSKGEPQDTINLYSTGLLD